MSCARNEAFFALLKFVSKIERSTLNSHIVVKALFSFLDHCQLLCIMPFMVQCESVVVVVFLINTLSCLNKLDSHVLRAHLSSVSKALSFFTECNSPKPPPSFPESTLHCCFSCWLTVNEKLFWYYKTGLFLWKISSAAYIHLLEIYYEYIVYIYIFIYLKADNIKVNEVDNL